MARLNQTQREFFMRKLRDTAHKKQAEYLTALKAAWPAYAYNSEPPMILTPEGIQNGSFQLNSPEVIYEKLRNNSHYNQWVGLSFSHKFYVQISDLFTAATPDATYLTEQRAAFNKLVSDYASLLQSEISKAEIVLMLGDNAELVAALANFEALEIPAVTPPAGLNVA